ncbi:hypothetical protein QTO34_006189, partial [Cnephaeus nilssonii]
MSSEFDLSKSPYGESCSSVLRFGQDNEEETDQYVVAPEGTWFACTTGITPCVSPLTLMHPRKPSLCILAHILPQVYYYSGEGGREHLGLALGRVSRALVIVPLLGWSGNSQISCNRHCSTARRTLYGLRRNLLFLYQPFRGHQRKPKSTQKKDSKIERKSKELRETGPLILLLIATFGSCLINSLTNYVQRRIQAVKLMVLRTHCHH